MQTILIVTEQATVPEKDGGHSITEEVLSTLESVGINPIACTTHQGDVIGRLTEWAADDGQGFDSLIDLLHQNNLIDGERRDAAVARRLQPGEPGYHEPVNASELRQDIAEWLLDSSDVARIVSRGTLAAAFAAFSKHHDKLTEILAKHKLLDLAAVRAAFRA